jgi:spoIIIJ-associated protein
MAITDKIAVAKRLNELLTNIIRLGGFKLKYRIVVDPPWAEEDRDWERPLILVDFSGSDSGMLTERGGELLRSFEYICKEACRLGPEDHDKVTFDANGFRKARFDELKMAASVAAERVQQTKAPYEFGAMSSRERRIIHLALKEHEDLRTESEGEGPARHLVVYPKDYKGRPKSTSIPSMGRRRR